MTTQYELLLVKLSAYTKEGLAELLAAEKNNPGWTNTRAIYLLALKQVVYNKDISV